MAHLSTPLAPALKGLFLAVMVAALVLGAPQPARAAAMQMGLQDEASLLSHDPNMQTNGLVDAKAAGAQLVRVTMLWDQVAAACAGQTMQALSDSTNSCYDWTVYDSLVSKARAMQMPILTSVYRFPSWVGPSTSTFNSPDLALAAYESFCHAAASRYSTHSTIGTINYWTIWNEPNSGTFLQQGPQTPALFARFVLVGSRAIKQVDPALLVATGPTGPKSTTKPIQWWKAVGPQLDKLGAGRYIDAISHNPYQIIVAPDKRAYIRSSGSVGMGNLADLLATTDRFSALKAKPVWYTEFAYESSARGVSLLLQAKWLADAARVSSQSPRVRMLVWYVLKDPVDVNDWHSGLRFTDGRPKPSYASFQRPISAFKAGRSVQVWGRSQVSAVTAHIVYRKLGTKAWKPLAARHDSSGFLVASLKTGQWQVAVQDALGMGPVLAVSV